MANPTGEALTDDELDQMLAVLTALGLPRENVKIHPDCQPDSPPDVPLRVSQSLLGLRL